MKRVFARLNNLKNNMIGIGHIGVAHSFLEIKSTLVKTHEIVREDGSDIPHIFTVYRE